MEGFFLIKKKKKICMICTLFDMISFIQKLFIQLSSFFLFFNYFYHIVTWEKKKKKINYLWPSDI